MILQEKNRFLVVQSPRQIARIIQSLQNTKRLPKVVIDNQRKTKKARESLRKLKLG